MVLGTGKVNSYNLFIDCIKVSCSKEVKLHGITIDNQLKFKRDTEDLCKKASYKLYSLRRLRPYLIVHKARLLTNLLIDNQISYGPLIWMFVGKTGANKIFKIHYRTRQVVYNVFTGSDSCDSLLLINIDMSIHQKHLRYLTVEVYKTVVEIYPEFMWTYFLKNPIPIPFDLRKDNKMFLLLARSVD